MDKNGQRVACKNWNVYSPQRQKQSYLFLAPLQWPWQGCCRKKNQSAMQLEDALAFLPHPQTLQTLPTPPRPFASVRFDPLAWSRGLTSAGSVAAGSDGLLWAGFTSPVAMSCMCFCVADVFFQFSHCTPKELVWGLFFLLPFLM